MITIAKIKAICQNPSTYESAGFVDKINLKIAVYFTWLFLHLGISANLVTILSGILCVLGGILLTSKSIMVFLIGVLLYNFFPVLDCCDGHVARYNNQSSMYGRFLDWYMVFIFDATMYIGISIGALSLNFSKILFILSLLAVITPLMIKTVLTGGWTAICWERLDVLAGKKSPPSKKKIQLDTQNNNHIQNHTKTIKTWINIFITASFSHLAPIVLLILSLSQIIINNYYIPNFDFRPFLIFYIGIIGPIYCLLLLRKRFKEKSFDKGYNLLFSESKFIELPKDYFF